MVGSNHGYYGYERSIRSKEAIEGYEVPVSLINKDMIDRYLVDNKLDYSNDDYEFLKTVSAKIWKETAKVIKPTSWHHTSTWFNETKHYSLETIASKILQMHKADQDNIFKPKPKVKKVKDPERYGFLVSQVWGGTRKFPQLTGYEKVYGIVKGEWLTCAESKTRFKITANKTIKYVETKSLAEAKKAKEEDK